MKLPIFIVTVVRDNVVEEQHAFSSCTASEECWSALYDKHIAGNNWSDYSVIAIRRVVEL